MHNSVKSANSDNKENFKLMLVILFFWSSPHGSKKKEFSFYQDIVNDTVLNNIITQTDVLEVNGIKHPSALMEVSSESSVVFQFLFTACFTHRNC